MAKTKDTKGAKEAKVEATSGQLNINVDKQEFIRTRDALITSWVSLEGALRDATRAYISHSNAVLGGTENLDLSKLDLTTFLSGAFPAPTELKEDVADVKVKAKRTRKPKDPNAPKRPLTAYLAWLGDNREKIHVELGPGQGRGGISSEGTKRWHALSEDAKQAYKDKYEKEQEKYKEELEAYKAKGGAIVDTPAEGDDDEDVADTDDVPAEAVQAGALAAADSDAASTASDSDSDEDSDEEVLPAPKEPTPPPAKTPRSATKGGRKKAVKETAEVPASSPPLPASSPTKAQNAAFTAVNGGKRKKETKAESVEEPKKKRSKRGEAAPASTPAEATKEVEETPGTGKREKRDRKKSRKSQGGDA